MRPRLAIVLTHPIQYYAPVFQLLAKQPIELKVFYTWGQAASTNYDPDFKREIRWDIPLLTGYDYVLLQNKATNPGPTHFNGIYAPDAIAAIEAFRPTAILVYGWAWRTHLQVMRHFSGKVPVWFRGDSTSLDPRPAVKELFRRIFLRWVYRHVDTAFYVGEQNKRYFQQIGFKEQQLVFAPHAVDNDRFGEPHTAEVRQIREEINVPHSDQLILFAGKLEPKKDPFLLLNAFQNLQDENVHLLFVGNGILEKRLKIAANKSPNKSRVHFREFQNQLRMPAFYQACDIYCLPSAGPGETWGLAVNEAMAAGRPVVVSDRVGCATDLVRDANGYIFRSGNETDLTEKLASLLAALKKGARPGKISQQIIEKWSFQHQVAVIVNELKELSCRK